MRAVQAHPAVELLRADARRNLLMLVWVLARHADWTELVTRPTWTRLMDRTGLSRSTVAAWLRWLREAGLLGTVTPGTTLQYRRGTACGLIDDGRGTEAAEYVLAVPAPPAPAHNPQDDRAGLAGTSAHEAATGPRRGPVERTRTPSSPPEVERKTRPTRAHERDTRAATLAALGPGGSDTGRWWPRTITPATRRDQLAAADRARREDVTLRAVSARHLRSLLRPVFAEGGTLADALYFVNHRADGTPWPYAGTPRYLPGWVRHRLAVWLDEDGRLREGLQLPSQAAATRADQLRAEQEHARQEHHQAAARRVEPAGPALRARTLLLQTSPGAARGMARQQHAARQAARKTPVAQPFVAPSSAAAAATQPSTPATAGPVTRLVEPEHEFRRQVLDRHHIEPARWASEPEPDVAPDDPVAVAADLARLIALTRPAAPPTAPDTAPDGA